MKLTERDLKLAGVNRLFESEESEVAIDNNIRTIEETLTRMHDMTNGDGELAKAVEAEVSAGTSHPDVINLLDTTNYKIGEALDYLESLRWKLEEGL